MKFSRYSTEDAIESMYCYKGTDVLINKLQIMDDELLIEAETKFTQLRLYRLQREPIEGRFSMTHLQKIHWYIFQDIYDFAGKLREESICKGNTEFCRSQYIKEHLVACLSGLKKENYLKGLDVIEFSKRLAYYMAELNIIHPFREGNGRASREFFRCLGLKCGYSINWDAIDKDYFIKASIMSVFSTEELENCIRKCIEKR